MQVVVAPKVVHVTGIVERIAAVVAARLAARCCISELMRARSNLSICLGLADLAVVESFGNSFSLRPIGVDKVHLTNPSSGIYLVRILAGAMLGRQMALRMIQSTLRPLCINGLSDRGPIGTGRNTAGHGSKHDDWGNPPHHRKMIARQRVTA